MKKFFLSALALLSCAFLFAEGGVISRVEFSGLKRTTSKYAESLLENFIGSKTEDFDEKQAESRLQAANLFDKIEMRLEDDGADGSVLRVDVTEKISFLPIPFAAVSSDGFMAALMLMDANAFGRQDMFVVTGIYSSDAIMGFAAFTKKPHGFKPGFSISGGAGKTDQTVTTDNDDEELFDFKKFYASGAASVLFSPGDHLALRLGFRYEYNKIDSGAEIENLETMHRFSLTFGAGLSTLPSWNGFFLSQSKIGFDGNLSLNDSRDFFPEFSANLNLQRPLFWPRLRLIGKASHNIIHDAPVNFQFSKQKASLTILPKKFITHEISSAIGGLELAVLNTRIGMFSIYGNYETGFAFAEYEDKRNFYHGPGGGLKLYLSKIAFPALSMGCSRNMVTKESYFACSIGMEL